MRPYAALCKPRIALMVALTTWLGFAVAGGHFGARLLWTLLGTTLAACACGCLNQWLEAAQDSRMTRTAKRPLPAGDLTSPQALAFGLSLAALGLAVLAWKSNALALGITGATLILYLLAYTPLKQVTPQTTWIGAVAGATPPLVGWAAARGNLAAQAWVLFAIQFLWQIPHFLAMFHMHRDDYEKAGFKVMPVVDDRGDVTAAQIALHSFTVLPACLAPSFCGMAGPAYGLGALVLGTAYLGLGMRASWTLARVDTRRLFLASLLYLPAIFGMLLLGGV